LQLQALTKLLGLELCSTLPTCPPSCRCGANHSFMPIVVEAVSPRVFLTDYVKKWLE